MNWYFCCLLLAAPVFGYSANRDLSTEGYSTGGSVRCYDCNYAPSGYVKAGAQHQDGGYQEVGYQRCALQREEDSELVDKYSCNSGTCFVRKDSNGMVYRGCADDENLPLDVIKENNCKYQGPQKSLWWFCQGDLCNSGQLGQDVDHCGSPPPPAGYGDVERQASYVPYAKDQPIGLVPAPSSYVPAGPPYPGASGGATTYSDYNPSPVLPAHEGAPAIPITYGPIPSSQYPSFPHHFAPHINRIPTFPPQPNPFFMPPFYGSPFGFFPYGGLMPFPFPFGRGYVGAGGDTQGTDIEYPGPVYGPGSSQNLAYAARSAPLPPPPPAQLFPPPAGYHQPTDPTSYKNRPLDGDNVLVGYAEYEPTVAPPVDAPTESYSVESTSYPDEPAPSQENFVPGVITDEYNPCSGECDSNPSGLYADPYRLDHFIQCGVGNYLGEPCTCCHPVYLACPSDTTFNDVEKVCTRSDDVTDDEYYYDYGNNINDNSIDNNDPYFGPEYEYYTSEFRPE